MTFVDLLDHTADIVRPTLQVTDDPRGDDREVYTTVHASAKCAFWAIMAPIGDYGAGETPTGKTMAWFEASVTPAERDVVVTLTGPDSGKRWRVIADRSPGRRFGSGAHHREVECVPFEGDMDGYDLS